MLRLTREVRFTIPQPPSEIHAPTNGLSGNLCEGPGVYLVLQLTLAGKADSRSQYIENIKTMDERVRSEAIPAIARLMREGAYTPARAAQLSARILRRDWDIATLHGLRLYVNPYLSWTVNGKELDVLHLTQRFEFSAAHRLNNPALDEATNQAIFGKCSNPAGHGHNYEFEVTLSGPLDQSGRIIDMDHFTRIVNQAVLDRFDHKHLNVQTEEFAELIPSVENIAKVIYDLLAPHFASPVRLDQIRVWETGKTWAEYGE